MNLLRTVWGPPLPTEAEVDAALNGDLQTTSDVLEAINNARLKALEDALPSHKTTTAAQVLDEAEELLNKIPGPPGRFTVQELLGYNHHRVGSLLRTMVERKEATYEEKTAYRARRYRSTKPQPTE